MANIRVLDSKLIRQTDLEILLFKFAAFDFCHYQGGAVTAFDK